MNIGDGSVYINGRYAGEGRVSLNRGMVENGETMIICSLGHCGRRATHKEEVSGKWYCYAHNPLLARFN